MKNKQMHPAISVLVISAAQLLAWFMGAIISENLDQFIALMVVVFSYLFLAVFSIVLAAQEKISKNTLMVNALALFTGAALALLIRMNTPNMGDAGIGLAVASIIVLILMGVNLLLTGLIIAGKKALG